MNWASTTKRFLLLTIMAALLLGGVPLHAEPDNDDDSLGRKYAEQIKKDYTLVDDPAIVERVQRIGKELADIANTVEVVATYGSSAVRKFNYEFTVIKDDDPNAFCLPGGKVFVNTGLLEMVETDDELAGVLAHEIAHAAHRHVAYILREQAKIDRYVALVALFGIVSKTKGKDLNNLLLGASMMRQGQVSGYTMKAEQDADRTAVAYLAKSRYSPIGLVDFMRKLEIRHEQHPSLPLGIYQTHPAPFRRVSYIRKACQEVGVEIDMRKLRGAAHAEIVEIPAGSGMYEVRISNRLIYTPAALAEDCCSKVRAEQIAEAVNKLLDSSVRPEDFVVDESEGVLLAKGEVLLRVEKPDLAGDSSDTSRALLGRARDALMRAAWADWLVNTCSLDLEDQP